MADQEKTKNEASQTANQKRPLDESELEKIVGGTGDDGGSDSTDSTVDEATQAHNKKAGLDPETGQPLRGGPAFPSPH